MPYKDKETRTTYNQNYQKIYYQVNKESEKLRLKTRKQELRKFISEFKKQCHYCNDTERLEFHHLDPRTKHMGIATMVSNGYSRETILKEIEKCIVVCKKCHIRLHVEFFKQHFYKG